MDSNCRAQFMKTLVLLMTILAIGGCAVLGTVPETHGHMGSSPAEPVTEDPAPALTDFSTQNQNIGPQIILPVTGGVPVLGIPLGGNMFQPVTGGVPVVGMPVLP
jgi:hypothetical protein